MRQSVVAAAMSRGQAGAVSGLASELVKGAMRMSILTKIGKCVAFTLVLSGALAGGMGNGARPATGNSAGSEQTVPPAEQPVEAQRKGPAAEPELLRDRSNDPQEGPPTKIDGLPADWKSEKEIPAVDAGSFQIPAMKLTVWVEKGWVVARLETEAGDLEWHVVLARATIAQPPKVDVDPSSGFPSVEYGSYFVRETLGHLRIMRERKDDKSPAWTMPEADPKQTQISGALNKLFVHEAERLVLVDQRFVEGQARRANPLPTQGTEKKSFRRDGFGGVLGHVFYGDATCQDEGDLLIAMRTPKLVRRGHPARTEVEEGNGNKPAPALAAKQWLNTTGELGLDQFKGKVVLLDFWGQWCAPCVKNLPSVQELHVKYKDKGLVVIGVHSADRSDKLDDFLKEKKITFPVMVDQGTTAKRYVIDTWPTYFLIDKAGKVSWGFANDPPPLRRSRSY